MTYPLSLSSLRTVPSKLSHLDTSARLYLRSNRRILTLLSETFSSVSLLYPSENTELRAQTAAAVASLLSLYANFPPPHSSLRLRIATLVLNILKSSQLAIEMAVAKRHKKYPSDTYSQVPVVTLIESLKAFARLLLLVERNEKCSILKASDEQIPDIPAPPVCTCGMKDIPGSDQVELKRGSRTSRSILAPVNRPRPFSTKTISGLEPPSSLLLNHRPSSDPIVEALFRVAYERRSNWFVRVFVPNVCEACNPVTQRPGLRQTMEGIQSSLNALTPGELAAEVMYIMRPVLHVMLIWRYGWRSWRAWFSALVVDVAARVAMAQPGNDSDVEERRRRMAQLVLYLGRSPLFDILIRRVIRRLVSPLRRIPLIGGVTSTSIEWITLLQQYWFYMSAS